MGLDYWADFVNTSNPFFIRGGHYTNTTNAGMFAFGRTDGSANINDGFRVAVPYSDIQKVKKEMLSPKKLCLRTWFRKCQRSLIPLVKKNTINT